MIVRDASWPQSAEPPRALLAAALGIALFLAAWGAIHYGFYARSRLADTPEYERYGDAIARGAVPYRDVRIEYPPGALPTFVLPSLETQEGDLEGFRHVFEALMAACGAAAVGCVAFVLVRDGAGSGRLAGGIGLAALAPLALGSVELSRYDLWPAALTALALAALISGREVLGLGVLGLGAAAKVYPAVLMPIAVVYVWRRSGRQAALIGLGAFVGVVLACVLPFVALAPGGVWDTIVQQTTRPLQIESLGASFLLAAHQLGGLGLTVNAGHSSENLGGSTAVVMAAVQSAIGIAALLAIWTWFARGPADRARLFRACAAAVCAVVALGKVLSPQFLIWLMPLVLLVRGRRGLAGGALLVLAMVLTQLWFPYRYWRLTSYLDERASWLVLARDLVLVALPALFVWPVHLRRPAPPAPRKRFRRASANAPQKTTVAATHSGRAMLPKLAGLAVLGAAAFALLATWTRAGELTRAPANAVEARQEAALYAAVCSTGGTSCVLSGMRRVSSSSWRLRLNVGCAILDTTRFFFIRAPRPKVLGVKAIAC